MLSDPPLNILQQPKRTVWCARKIKGLSSHPQRCSAQPFKQSEGGAGAGQASGTFCSDAGLRLHSRGLCEARFLAVHLPESRARLRAAWRLSRRYTFPSARTHLSQEPVCRQVAREGPPPAPGLRGPARPQAGGGTHHPHQVHRGDPTSARSTGTCSLRGNGKLML